MKLFNGNKRFIKPVLIVALLITLLGTATACEALGQFPTALSPEEEEAPSTTLITKDKAILAVYEYLLGQAESHEAKVYLAEFYSISDNWSAESEFFKDGSGIWYILVDMSSNEPWKWKPYWQQASWFVFQDGRVLPSNRFQANALRIEADLQELSPQPD